MLSNPDPIRQRSLTICIERIKFILRDHYEEQSGLRSLFWYYNISNLADKRS